MGPREKWTAAARDVVGQDVADVVPLGRFEEGGRLWTVLGVLVFGAIVFADEFVGLPGPRILVYFVGALAMTLIWQLGRKPVFVVRTPTGLVVTSSSRWSPRPAAPVLGPLDPATVSGPTGLLHNTYVIGGLRHQVGLPAKKRFEEMVAAARGEHATP
jgi:hypothetical protein